MIINLVLKENIYYIALDIKHAKGWKKLVQVLIAPFKLLYYVCETLFWVKQVFFAVNNLEVLISRIEAKNHKR